MPIKAMKRSASKAGQKKAGGVAKKCRVLVSTIRHAESIPQPVRSMLCDTLVRTFGTYKEERHPLQNTVSNLVGTVLKEAQNKLQATINEAQQKKAAVESEASDLIAANNAALAASETAAKALADSKAALADAKTAVKDGKSAVHDRKEEVKAAEADVADATSKKEGLELLATGTINPVKEGTMHGATAGRAVGKEMGPHLEPEFKECVVKTFSKAASAWGTFDNIVSKRLEESMKNVLAGLASDLAAKTSAKDTSAANLETAQGALAGAEEQAKALEKNVEEITAAAKEAEAAAKAATTALKPHQHHIDKAAGACKHAEDAMAAFIKDTLGAYNAVEAHTAPPPEPEAEAPAVEAAMAPAPAPAARQTPTILPSPGVLSWVAQASGLARSPQLAATPRTA